ncbi:hypothetical protein [Glycomyces sp. NPDC047010]|uniref:hypothetical protein n=1 Tax=Glycomyces sp. NPDC047010 TaxID=3155023 RepID=UPI0033DA7DA6
MRQSVRAVLRPVTAVGVCAVVFGLTGCGAGEDGDAGAASGTESVEVAESSAEATAEETAEGGTEGTESAFSPCDLETDAEPGDPRLESVVGTWTAVGESFLSDSEGQGSTFCIDGDGDVSYSAPEGDWIGALTIGEATDHAVQLESLDDQTLTEWVFRYEAEEDLIDVGTPGEGGLPYTRVQ